MKKKISSGILALVFLLQAFLPSFAYANQAKPQDTKLISEDFRGSDNTVTIGKLKGVGFSKDNPTASISIEKVKEKNRKNTDALDGLEISDENIPQAMMSSGSPYIQGQQPADPDKPKYWANVQGELTTRGIDGTTFDWNKVLGQGAKVKLLFTQTNGNVMTGVTYSLLVDKDGTYTWQGSDGKPTYLPLYDANGKPYTYNVQIERNYSKNVQLIVQESNGTPKAKFREEGDKQVATISFLDIKIQQVASTKFVSEWHTGVNEADRPQIEGYFKVDDETDNDFNFPKNDTTRTILRESFVENFVEDEDNGPWSFNSSELETTPKTVKVKTGTQGLTFEENNGVKTVKSGDHKFKYDFTYDVINGGKLTMTEILPVTFDANGGKFASIVDPNVEQKIVKEVDYEKDLTGEVEKPTKDRETFKGWGTKDAQGNITPVTEGVFKNIKEAKTFYAIWDNNDIVVDQLEVKESFKDGDTWVNNFIPTLDQLKKQVKIKDSNGDPQPLANDDTFEILDDSGVAITGDALKDYLYEKLQEKDNPNGEPTRVETVKAKVTVNGTSKIVEIPIKVVKNIYEAKTLTNKPYYVPKDYVKVTLDPTDKATDSQKTYYYVNKEAMVVIPGKDPVGKEGNNFVNWTIPGTSAPKEYKLADRHQFGGETIITANYVNNVVEQKEGEGKPKVPDDFVKVIVDTTDDASNETKFTRTFWVKRETPVRIKVDNPVAANATKTFSKWRTKQYDGLYKVIDLNVDQKFSEKETLIEAFYSLLAIEQKDGLPKPDAVPDNFIRIYLDTTDKATVKKRSTWWVAPDKPSIKFALDSPVGKEVTDGNSHYKWKFDYRWKSDKNELKKTEEIRGNIIYDIDTTKVYDEEVFYAQYKTDNVIPKFNDDGSENDKPDGYVTLTFDKGEHGKEITGQTVYYVNPKANPAKTLGDASIKKPEVKAETGWKQKAGADAWDTADTFEIKADNTVKAQYEPIANVIPQEKEDGSDKPDGYITVTFSTETNGKIEGSTKTTKVVYVNPNKAVMLKDQAPKVTANTGFEFAGWDTQIERAIQYTENTVIKAKYKTIDDVIPQEKTDGSDKPAGYYTVTFDKGDHGKELTGKTVYYVKPNTEVTVPAPGVTPATGWKQKAGTDAWDQALTQTFAKDTTIRAQYDPLDDVIPQKNTDGSDKPDGYFTVTFDKGDHGKELTGKTVYYVKPNTEVTVPAPGVTPASGWMQKTGTDAWDKPLTQTFAEDTIIKAQYDPLADIIPQEKTDGSDKPDGYITLTFDKGDHGKEITGQTVYYVNPKADPVKTLGDTSIVKPTVKAETGYEFTGWDKLDTTKLEGPEDVIVKAKYEGLDDVIPKKTDNESDKPEGYITVTFVKGEHGKELTGQAVYYINPNKAVALKDKAPKVTSDTGYDFAGWDIQIEKKIQYSNGDVITAQYNEKGDVIPQENPDGSDKPAGYLTVTFDKGAHGELSGKTVYYVNPNKEVTVPAPTVIPGTDYVFDKWDQSLTQKFTAENTTITAEYKEIPYNPSVDAEYVLTEIGKQPTVVDYAKVIHVSGGTGTVLRIVEQPDVSSKGMKTAKVEVEITNGSKTTKKIVEVPVFVKPDPEIIEKPYPVPGDCNNSCDQPNKPNQPNQPNIGMDALNTTDHYQYLIGYPNGNFAPNRGMTRAEVATMFTRLLRERPVKGQRYYTGFSDIQDGDWYANTVGYAVQVGIVSGYPDGSFKPNKPITRAEFASIASRFDALAQGNNIAFNDLAPSHWGYNAIRSAATKGWISGYPDNTFRPEKAISRAEVTSITNRMLNRYADLYWIDAHRGEVIRFGDVKRGDWYFEPIMEATMGHDFIRDRDGKTEHWTGLNGKSFI